MVAPDEFVEAFNLLSKPILRRPQKTLELQAIQQ